MRIRKIKRASLLCVLSLIVIACNEPTISSNSQDESSSSEPITSNYLFANGQSDYTIVLPNSTDATVESAALELSAFYKIATGFTLPIVQEQDVDSPNSHGIFLDKTTAANNLNIVADKSLLKETGYILKTIEESIYLVGATTMGTLYGVYDLLEKTINYCCYSYDEVYCDTNVKDIALEQYDIAFVPTVTYRYPFVKYIGVNALTAHRMRCTTQSETFVEFEGNTWCHTCENLLPFLSYGNDHPTWFSSDNTQWCFSEALVNDEMYSIIYQNFKAGVLANPTGKYASISQNDVNTWCTCPRCTAEKNKYGSDVAVLIKFVNKVARDVKKDPDLMHRDFYIKTFSYHKTSAALTFIDEEVMCEDNVSIMFAPIRANYTTSFEDSSNVSTLAALEALHQVCKHIIVWTYDAHFPQYFIPYNSFTGRKERYDTLSKNGVDLIFDQMSYNSWQSLSILRAYLTSRMSWNNSLNMGELIADFCDHYYRDASITMQKYIDSYRTWSLYAYNVLGMHTDINGSNFLNSIFWRKGVLLEWMDIFEQALKDIEILLWKDKDLYEKVRLRIVTESLTARYLLISCWYQTYSNDELLQMKLDFRKDVYECGVNQYSEARSVEVLFDTWGI
ncbi:MAG: DUF4838 domain-containing protein [Bacilli bacterium]|jgi:hypothetical protein